MANQQGFTLFEILIAIFVIGILASIAIMTFTGPRKTIDLQSGQTTLASVSNRMLQWGSSNQSNFKIPELSTSDQNNSNLLPVAKNKLKIDTGANFDWTTHSSLSQFLTAVNTSVQDNQGTIFVGSCDQNASNPTWVCNNVITCIRYFENGKPLCSEQIAYMREGIPLTGTQTFASFPYNEGTGVKDVRRFLVPKTATTSSTPINEAFDIIARSCGVGSESGGTWPEKPSPDLNATQISNMRITTPCSTNKNTLDENIRPDNNDGQQHCAGTSQQDCYRNYGS